jgi:hypothetical protein
MYSVSSLGAAGLALVVAIAVTALVAGVLRLFPRSLDSVTAGVDCPLTGRPATSQLARDTWTRRFVDVTSCSVLGTPAGALCHKGCLLAVARSPRFTRS